MIVSIHQPAYLPWLGYFHRIAASDVHIVLDHVQFEKNSYTNRNRILLDGKPHWLTIPLLTRGRFGQLPFACVEIDGKQDWRTRHLETLRHAYRKAPYFHLYFDRVPDHVTTAHPHLGSVLRDGLHWFLRELNIQTRIVYSSDLSCTETKSSLVEELCLKTGATAYLSGPLGRNYLNLEQFTKRGVTVFFHDYQHPEYPQRGERFAPFLSALDLLFNCGPDSRAVLERGQPSVC